MNWIRKYSRFSSKSAVLAINSDMAGFVYFWFESKAVESVFLCIWLILRGRKTERAKKRECKINFCSLISQANRGIFSCIRKFAEAEKFWLIVCVTCFYWRKRDDLRLPNEVWSIVFIASIIHMLKPRVIQWRFSCQAKYAYVHKRVVELQ